MKTRTNGIITVAASLLLLTAMLFSGCSEITTGGSDGSGYTPPPGMGAIRLNLNKDIARTILPDDVTQASDFAEFDLLISNSSGVVIKQDSTTTRYGYADFSTPVALFQGVYKIDILAYLDNDDTIPAAFWSSGLTPDINVVGGTTTPAIDVTLAPYTDEAGEGDFVWVITDGITGNVTQLNLTITKLDGSDVTNNGTTDITSDLNNTGSPKTLKSGYYMITFEVIKGTGLTASSYVFRQILHIYTGMTSTFTYTIADDYLVIKSGTRTFTFVYETKGTELVIEGDNFGSVSEDSLVQLSKGTTQSDTFTINIADFTTVEVYCSNGTTLTLGGTGNDELEIEAGTAPFDNVGDIFIITVIGTDSDGIPTSISFTVEITT